MKRILSGLFVLLVLGTACSKSDTAPNNPSLLGKWTRQTAVEWFTPTSGPIIKDTLSYANNGTYVDFRADGKAYSWNTSPAGSYYDTASYQVNGNTLIVFDPPSLPDTATIQTLTNNTLSLYVRKVFTTGVTERWFGWKK